MWCLAGDNMGRPSVLSHKNNSNSRLISTL